MNSWDNTLCASRGFVGAGQRSAIRVTIPSSCPRHPSKAMWGIPPSSRTSAYPGSVRALLSCDQESKQRSPAQSPRGLVPWTAVRSSRARALRCEQSPHPPISSAGKTVPPAGADVCLSRGPDQHPLGGDTATLLVGRPGSKAYRGRLFPRALSRGQRSTA